jgi:hypothetical protein
MTREKYIESRKRINKSYYDRNRDKILAYQTEYRKLIQKYNAIRKP